MRNVKDFDFSKVILGSQIDLALVGQAAIDGFLSPGASEELTKLARKIRNKQVALALLVLFDKVILPDSTEGNYKIPILESEGILQINRDDQFLIDDFAESDWCRNRKPEVFVKVLDRTVSVRPLVLEYLARRPSKFVDVIAHSIGYTRKEIINSIIDFAYFYYLEDKDRLDTNILVQELSSSLVKEFKKGLRSQPGREGLDSFDAILFGAALAGVTLEYYMRLSESLRIGVATNEFSGQGQLWNRHPEIQARIEGIGKTFCLVRAALHEESNFFPRIEGVKHALRLRKDPSLKAFRDQLGLFQQGLIRGDGSDIYRLVKEVHRSAQALKRKTLVLQGLEWLTFASLPVSLVETLIHGLPVASLGLSIFSISANVYGNRVNNRHQWVIFGR